MGLIKQVKNVDIPEIRSRARAMLACELAEGVEFAFIGGSVARADVTPTSDVDLFVATKGTLSPAQKDSLRASAFEMNVALGFVPDPEYPLEVFSLESCYRLLDSDTLTTVLQETHTTSLPSTDCDADEVEVVRCLTGRQVEVVSSPHLSILADFAKAKLEASLNCVPSEGHVQVLKMLKFAVK